MAGRAKSEGGAQRQGKLSAGIARDGRIDEKSEYDIEQVKD